MGRRIYLASSWRNEDQPQMLMALRDAGFDVYDFRNPVPGNIGFAWSDIDPDWQKWTTREFIAGLNHEVAERGYAFDYDAMEWADTFVLLLPCGRSAHLELGWAVGAGKETAIFAPPEGPMEPELMYKMVDLITDDIDKLEAWLKGE